MARSAVERSTTKRAAGRRSPAPARSSAARPANGREPAGEPADAAPAASKSSSKPVPAPKPVAALKTTSSSAAKRPKAPAKVVAKAAETPVAAPHKALSPTENPARKARTAAKRGPGTTSAKSAGPRKAAGPSAPAREPGSAADASSASTANGGDRAKDAKHPGANETRGGQTAGAEQANPFLTPDVEAFAANMARLFEEGGKALSAYLRPRETGARKPSGGDEVVDIVKTLGQVAERWMASPSRTVEAQRAFAGGFLELWSSSLKRFSGEETPPVVAPDPRDGRFKDPEWTSSPFFDFLKQAYLHSSRWAERMVDEAHELDPHTRQKAAFYVRQISNAVSPSNFVPTNPELIRETLASKGDNLVRGMRMLAEDISAGNGELRIRQTDGSNFEVGRNLATTPGKVVFRNELFELLQYAPATEMVRTRPVLIVPPWINKFYILDLTPEKSFIKWCVDQGLTVFCISWVNPDARHAAKSFDDYMRDGVLAAIEVVKTICRSEQVDAAGYCVGGTLLAVTLAWLAARGESPIASATFLTTQVDFTHAGDLKVFVDEEQVKTVEAKMAEFGFLEGSSMANAFNMLRSNDLVWPYVVNNYMKGKAPFPFDLLYWNSDATRMPAANHSFYLRGCYLNNDLANGRMTVGGERLDLTRISVPVYELATREDHIAPARSAFLGAQLFGGPVRFVLAGSGHIAGVVNPPAKMKYQHWVGEAPNGAFEDWFAQAEEKPGSWWPDWRAWLSALDATATKARIPGEGPYPALDDAPGTYVKVRV